MKLTLNDKMIIGILRAWAKRNLGNEGMEIDTLEFGKDNLVITLKESLEVEAEE